MCPFPDSKESSSVNCYEQELLKLMLSFIRYNQFEEAICCAIEFKDKKQGALLMDEMFCVEGSKGVKFEVDNMIDNEFQQTPLHHTAKSNNPYAYYVLLLQGANSYQKDSTGKTPSDYKVKHKWDQDQLSEFKTALLKHQRPSDTPLPRCSS